MNITFKQKLDDFHNTRVLMAKEAGDQIFVEKGRLQLRKSSKKQSKPETKEVKYLISSLLKRVDVGIGPLTAANVEKFVFEKIFPLNHRICNPSAMQQNPVLRAVIARRVEALTPEVEKDFNVVRCRQRIQEVDAKIRQIGWQLLNPVRMLNNFGVLAIGGKVDRTLEKELKYLQWRKTRDEKYLGVLKEALFGLKMKLNHESGAENNGWSGSFFWRSYLTNRKLGVYKPSDQDSISPGSPHSFARFRLKFIPSDNGVIVSQSGKSHIAEAGARIAAEAFHRTLIDMQEDGLELPFEEKDAVVPDTRIVEVNFSSGATEQGIGSLQLFLKRCLPLTEAFGIDKRSFQRKGGAGPDPSTNLLPQYQWLKLLHYLIFAQDDHAENTLAITNLENEVVAMKAIDNGQSFPAKPLEHGFIEKRILSMKPMSGLKHRLAKEKILPFFREFLQRFSEQGYLDRLGNELYAFYQDPSNYPEGKVEDPTITANRIRLLMRRFGVLDRLFVKQGRSLNALLQFLKGDGVDVSR